MPTVKLTEQVIAKATLPPGCDDLLLWDTELTGFALRIRPQSTSWIVAYRPRGAGRSAHMRRLKLASLQVVPRLADARRLAREALGKVATGTDPLAERAEVKRRANARLTDLLKRYDEELERRQFVNRRTVIAGLKRNLAEHLQQDVGAITGADLVVIIDRLEKAGRRGAAEGFRANARTFFAWCVVKAKVLSTNPLAGYRKERATRADRIAKAEHDRALSDAEVAAVWTAADLATTFGRLLRFYILTGCRRGEGAGVSWPMVDKAAARIDLPASFVKQGRGHSVFIAPLLAEVLDGCAIDARSDLVFPSPKSGTRMSGWTQLLAGFRKRCSVEFDLHDLRRTFRTGLSRLGVEPDIAELALGHARADLEAIYNRDRREVLIRNAFRRWAEHLEVVTRPVNDDVFD